MTSAIFHPGPANMPFSSAVRVGELVFLSGQIPFDQDGRPHTGDIGEQTRAVLDSIGITLQGLGLSMRNVVKATVWLSDMHHFAAFNEVYRRYFETGRYPVRSLVKAELAFGVGVEIEVVAHDEPG